MEDNGTHYHVMGVCREHDVKNLGALIDKDETLNVIHNVIIDKMIENGNKIEILGRTPTILDYEMTDSDGDVHSMFLTYRVCHMPFDLCNMMHQIETMADIARFAARGIDVSNLAIPANEDGSPVRDSQEENSLVYDDSLISSIEDFLKNQEGDAPNA